MKNVHKMKNKPDPTILKISFLSSEIVKRTPKSHDTIPLTAYKEWLLTPDNAKLIQYIFS
jgi:hypothetical protein